MGYKIFVSYKYADSSVANLSPWKNATVRDYVDLIESYLADHSDHIYKGEHDGEDLSCFKQETIESKLRDRIFDSSITIVLISPGMRNYYCAETEQWIPWEISYSLKECSRNNKHSKSNGLLYLVLPGALCYYDYYIRHDYYGRIYYDEHISFNIIERNRNNLKNYYSKPSDYAITVRWCDFIKNPSCYIQLTEKQRDISHLYNIYKQA